MSSPQVTVVIPAYNGAKTILATLRSVALQTLQDIEVIIIDDGSTDHTARIARDFAAQDARFRLISVANGGVAQARNIGIREARALFVAPLDADDLWHPEKLERQLAHIIDSPGVSLVYSGRRIVDADDIVVRTALAPSLEGAVYHRFIALNAVGNGSAIMFRKADALAVGSYDTGLKQSGAQGCEDYLLQVRLARLGEVRIAPGFLVGYRKSAGAMSENTTKMMQSRILAMEMIASADPMAKSTALATLGKFHFWMALTYLAKLDVRNGSKEVLAWVQNWTSSSLSDGLAYVRYRLFKRQNALTGHGPIPGFGHVPAHGRAFSTYGVDEDAVYGSHRYVASVVQKLAVADEAMLSHFDVGR